MYNLNRIFIGLFVLVVGTLVYFTDRLPEKIYFIQKLGLPTHVFQFSGRLFGSLGNYLPSFAHVFALILITAGMVIESKRGYLYVSLTWLFIDGVFELGQSDAFSIAAWVPGWFETIPFFENTGAYFRSSTFDPLDMLFIVIGAVAAYLVLLWTEKEHR